MTVKRTIECQLYAAKPELISPTLEELLLKFSLGNLNLDRLVNLLGMAPLVVCIVFDGGREEGVDEGGLSQARLASNLNV